MRNISKKSATKTEKERLDLVILSNKIKTIGTTIVKLGDRYFKAKELG